MCGREGGSAGVEGRSTSSEPSHCAQSCVLCRKPKPGHNTRAPCSELVAKFHQSRNPLARRLGLQLEEQLAGQEEGVSPAIAAAWAATEAKRDALQWLPARAPPRAPPSPGQCPAMVLPRGSPSHR